MSAESAADASGTRFLAVLDFEATCWDDDREKQRREAEIIELPTVLYRVPTAVAADAGAPLERAGEWRAFVRPTRNPTLSAYAKRLTGITQAEVDAAQPLDHVLAAHSAWLDSATGGAAVVFVTCGDWDLGTCLPLELHNKGLAAPAPHYSRWINLKREFATAFDVRGRPPDMVDMLRVAGLALEGRHHSGLDDARNIGHCLQACWRRGHRSFRVRTAAGMAQPFRRG